MFELHPVGLFCLFATIVIALVVVVAIFNYRMAEKRRKELAMWAARNGWDFRADKDHDMDNRFPQFKCLHEGNERYAYNIVEGGWQEHGLCAFDYHYETYSRNNKGQRQTQHHYFSAVVLDTTLPLKQLSIRSEGFFDKVAEFFGWDDIDFESAEFSREFHIKAPDRKWAFDVIQQTTMEFLLASPRFALEMDAGCLIAYRSSTFDIATFDSAVAVCGGVLERLPAYLLKDMKDNPTS
jgi:hypothetical protein